MTAENKLEFYRVSHISRIVCLISATKGKKLSKSRINTALIISFLQLKCATQLDCYVVMYRLIIVFLRSKNYDFNIDARDDLGAAFYIFNFAQQE